MWMRWPLHVQHPSRVSHQQIEKEAVELERFPIDCLSNKPRCRALWRFPAKIPKSSFDLCLILRSTELNLCVGVKSLPDNLIVITVDFDLHAAAANNPAITAANHG